MLQRTGFITIDRQSIPLSQAGTAISAALSPLPGSGLSQTFTIDLTTPDAEAFDALESFELEFAPFIGNHALGTPRLCHTIASIGSDKDSLLLQLRDDSTGQLFPDIPMPFPAPPLRPQQAAALCRPQAHRLPLTTAAPQPRSSFPLPSSPNTLVATPPI